VWTHAHDNARTRHAHVHSRWRRIQRQSRSGGDTLLRHAKIRFFESEVTHAHTRVCVCVCVQNPKFAGSVCVV